ncbi:hypothetical protein ACFVH0_04555 [Streptomyces sp. NPDC127117]|uniref:hypothetical protein n=1 Tax=Streptomyces sp. NPDC127117 TaxID=3345368 RepID=UPI003642667A
MQTARLRTHVRTRSLPSAPDAFSAEYGRVRLIAAGTGMPREPDGRRPPTLGTEQTRRTPENPLATPPRTGP